LDDIFLSQVQACALDRWSPRIGDPSLMGWFTVAIYVFAALVALRVFATAWFPLASRRRERLFWLIVVVLLFALAVNKQLDLQSYLTVAGRCMSKLQGWYADRRSVQKHVIIALIVTMSAVGLWAAYAMRGTLRRNALAVVGLAFLILFVAVRAVGFHHVDALLKVNVHNVRLNWLLELTGPTLIILCGLSLLSPRVRGQSRA
jgi:hypothetical protein